MKKLPFRLMKKGIGAKHGAPINVAFVDIQDILENGLTETEALDAIASYMNAPTAINLFNMDAITTTSDGVLVESAITTMAAADKGRVHKEFGTLRMKQIEIDDELISLEPHLKQIKALGLESRPLFRGPDPKDKLIPVHNVVMTGAAINNNSATEIMNAITMEEMLLPYLGQKQIMEDGEILFGVTGEVISVGIGMTVAEKYGRVFPTRQFKAGETAHGSGEYAKTLKANIPCVVAPKEVLAKYTVAALEAGMIPGREIGCSPAVLSLAHALGKEIDFERIQPAAWAELNSVGITESQLLTPSPKMSVEEAIQSAEKIIPGVKNPQRVKSTDVIEKITISV